MKKQFFVVAAVLISSQLTAQLKHQLQDADTTGKTLDEVVMTANKYPNKTSLTGKVVTVITKEQLERSGGKDLAQILTEQAGIYVGGANSNPGKDKSLYLRGARVDHTLITIDGIPVYDAAGIGGNFDIRNIAIENIERIEILKGSQSTLYGSDAIAGVINIISKKAGTKPVNGSADLSYGSYQSFRGNMGLTGTKDKLDYNINFSSNKTDGINEAISTSANADKDGYSQNGFAAQFGIAAIKNIYIQPYFRYTKIKGDLDQGAFTDELDYTFHQKSFQTGLRNELNIGKAKLNVLYSFNSINRTYTDDSIKSRNGYDTYSRGSYKGGEHFVDAYIHIPLHKNIKLTGGIDFRNSSSDQEYFSVGFYGPYTSRYSSDSLKQNQLSLYAALNLNSKTGFNLELGNRLIIHSAYGSYDIFNINPSFLLNKKWKLFANLSTAYKTPSLYQLFSEYGNDKLQPESAITAEGGVQYYSPNNKINSRITLFNRNVKDVLFFYFNSSTFQSQYINQDKQNDYGLELELKINISKKITLGTYYSFTDGELMTKNNGKDTAYFNLLRRPKNSFGINLGNKINERLFISSNMMLIGKRTDAYFDAVSFQTINTTLKSYFLWNLYAEYRFTNLKTKLFADMRNITDSRYTEISGFNTTGMTIQTGLKIQF
jgi:vitamin B12 transporter